MIECNDKTFRLLTDHTAYLFLVTPFGHLEHLHYGGPVSMADGPALGVKNTIARGSSILYVTAAIPTAWTTWPSNGAAWARGIFATRPRR